MLGCKRPKIELITLSFLFYFLRRLIYCSDCTAKSAPLTSSKKPVRVCDKCFDEVTSGTAKVSLLIAWHLNNRMNLHDTERNTFDSQLGKKSEKQIKFSRSGKSQKNKLNFQDREKVREYYSDTGKIYIFEKSQGKVKFQVNVMSFILSWLSSRWEVEKLSFYVMLILLMYSLLMASLVRLFSW